MSDDIVARLRAVLHNDRSVELMNREAADEIRVLRAYAEAIANKLREVESERDRYRGLYLKTLAFDYKAKGVQWRTYVNPQRSDGLFVAGVGSLEHPMQAVPRGVASVGFQLPHADAEELVVLLNSWTAHLEEEDFQ